MAFPALFLLGYCSCFVCKVKAKIHKKDLWLSLCTGPNGHHGFLAVVAVCFVCVAKKRVLMSPLSFNGSREEKE